MDLKLIKQYFDICLQQQNTLQQNRSTIESLLVSSYSLYELIGTNKQPSLSSAMIQKYIESFNWQNRVSSIDTNRILENGNYRVFNRDSKNTQNNKQDNSGEQKRALQQGIQLLIKNWGNKEDKTINYDQFSILIKNAHQMPNPHRNKADFKHKQALFQFLIKQISSLVLIESYKQAIYHTFKNMTDLYEMLTADYNFDKKHLERLYLSYGERPEPSSIEKISKRAQLPWNFEKFMSLFKKNSKSQKNTEYKVFYSSIRKQKKGDATPDRLLTTPRKDKVRLYPSSTKLTKGQINQISEQSRVMTQFTLGNQSRRRPETNIELLEDILNLEQQFIEHKINLIMRTDFDLELAYQRHGKKFQKILNQRLGVCNFSAFCRFILPKTYQHRYLSFIRYQQDNRLTAETQSQINELISLYSNKQAHIKQLWATFDAQTTYRSLCLPSEDRIKSSKLKEYFPSRSVEILLERFDPYKKGLIELTSFQ